MESINFQDIVEQLLPWQKLIIPTIIAMPAIAKILIYILRKIFGFELKDEKRKRIKERIEIAKYLTNSNPDNDLVTYMVFEALSGHKLNRNTIDWITYCDHPAIALEIFEGAPFFLQIEEIKNQDLNTKTLRRKRIKWVENYGRLIYNLSMIFGLIIVAFFASFFAWGVVTFINISSRIEFDSLLQVWLFIMLLVVFVFEILFFLWFGRKVERAGVFLLRVVRSYETISDELTIQRTD